MPPSQPKHNLPPSRPLKTWDATPTDPFIDLTRSIGALQNQLALLGFHQKSDNTPNESIAYIDLTGFLCSTGETEPGETRAIKMTTSLVATSGLDANTVWKLLYQYMPYSRRTELERVQAIFDGWWKQIVRQHRLRLALVRHAKSILPLLDNAVMESLQVAMERNGFETAHALAKEIKGNIRRLKLVFGKRQGKHTNKEAHHAERELVRQFLNVVPDQIYADACRRTHELLLAWAGAQAPKGWESIQARHRNLIPKQNRKRRVCTWWD